MKWPKKVKFDPERVKAMKEFRKKVEPEHKRFIEQLERQSKGMTEKEMREIEITC